MRLLRRKLHGGEKSISVTLSNNEKIKLFMTLFEGRTDIYGTYDPATGSSRVVNATVTRQTILNHLTGRQPYGVFLLKDDHVRAIVIDFDIDDGTLPIEFVTC